MNRQKRFLTAFLCCLLAGLPLAACSAAENRQASMGTAAPAASRQASAAPHTPSSSPLEGGTLSPAAQEAASSPASRPASRAPAGSVSSRPAPVGDGRVVALDPGHQAPQVDMRALEPNGPGSPVKKAKCTTGTEGAASGKGEYALNLEVSLKLRALLEEKGYTVVMTRTSNDAAISNAERAQLANRAGADIYVRIHANGVEDPSVRGALALVPSAENPYVGQLAGASDALAQAVLAAYCDATGFSSQGVSVNDTMTGINWSQAPVMILEMGFMTNPEEDLRMADPAFQERMAGGIARGIDRYFGGAGQERAAA